EGCGLGLDRGRRLPPAATAPAAAAPTPALAGGCGRFLAPGGLLLGGGRRAAVADLGLRDQGLGSRVGRGSALARAVGKIGPAVVGCRGLSPRGRRGSGGAFGLSASR